jgi:hypothetical protein
MENCAPNLLLALASNSNLIALAVAGRSALSNLRVNDILALHGELVARSRNSDLRAHNGYLEIGYLLSRLMGTVDLSWQDESARGT